ncbi:MAG: OsmC family protein [Candidatus Rifleibacteriota bacterium]
MAKKNVKVSLNLIENFKIEANAGNHKMFVDQPAVAGGSDAGPNPLEYFLAGLGACLITIGKIAAKQKRIEIRSFSVEVDGLLDLDGLMGKDPSKRAGFEEIVLNVKLDADLSDDEKMAFLKEVENRCPVADNVLRQSKISFKLA